MQVRPKKRWSCFWKLAGQKCFSNLPAHIFDCVSENIPFVSKKDITKAKTQTKKQKKLKKKRDIKNKSKKRRKKMLLL